MHNNQSLLTFQLSCDQSQLQQDSLVWREETVSSLDGLQVALSPLTEQVWLLLCVEM